MDKISDISTVRIKRKKTVKRWVKKAPCGGQAVQNFIANDSRMLQLNGLDVYIFDKKISYNFYHMKNMFHYLKWYSIGK
jgi:hypothetical protein